MCNTMWILCYEVKATFLTCRNRGHIRKIPVTLHPTKPGKKFYHKWGPQGVVQETMGFSCITE